MKTISQSNIETIIKTMADTALANEEYFSDLDGVMGDGDFGASLAGGYNAILKKWDEINRADAGAFLLNISTIWTANAGGCSGPVWGTLFMRCGMAFKGKTEVTLEDAIKALESAIQGIMKRGGAVLGDKTMLDALDAIVNVFKQHVDADVPLIEVFKKAADAAVEMKETTKGWMARRGRQSFTAERSIGTYDPGIVAVGVFCTAIVEALQ